jgi:hypothetical protein
LEVRFDIVTGDFVVQHPELHHYTNYDGLRGIIESSTIWATHFRCLNDSAEVTLLQGFLINPMKERALRAAVALSGGNRHERRAITNASNRSELGRQTQAFIEALFETGFTGRLITPLAEPFIASFCAHSLEQDYELSNGLLSQWRAYGGGEGAERYCIVFDTKQLVDMLIREGEAHYWLYLNLDRVQYAFSELNVEELYPEFMNLCEIDLVKFLQGGKGNGDYIFYNCPQLTTQDVDI